MPIYGYQCDDCGHRYDRLQKLSEDDPTHCPECQSSALRRQISAPSFRLAGSGWYETDFKKEGDTKRNLVDSGSKSESGESGGGKSDSKADSKADSKSSDASAGSSSSRSETRSDSKPATPAPKPAAPAAPSSGG